MDQQLSQKLGAYSEKSHQIAQIKHESFIEKRPFKPQQGFNRPSKQLLAYAQKILPLLKRSVQNPDRAYFFTSTQHDNRTQYQSCCHNGYVLNQKQSSSGIYSQSNTGNFLVQRYICRKVCDDPDKFDKNHCNFEIEVLRITDDEGKIQQIKNYHAAHKDDYNYYNLMLFNENGMKNGGVIPLSETVAEEFKQIIDNFANKEEDKVALNGNIVEKTEQEFRKMVKAYKYMEKERQKTMMKLNLENQLRKIITNEMEIKVIKLCKDEVEGHVQKDKDPITTLKDLNKKGTDVPGSLRKTGFNNQGEFIRNAYLIFMQDFTKDPLRIEMTNYRLYIEATFNSIADINYEVWLLRTFLPELAMTVTFGMILLPKEQIYGDNPEIQEYTLDLTLKAMTQVLFLYARNIFFACKKNLDFILKVSRCIHKIDPTITFKMCFNNYNFKILDFMAKQTPRELADDQNLVNYEQQELLFSQLRSLCFLPKKYVKDTVDLIEYLLEQHKHPQSLAILEAFKNEFMVSDRHLELWNLHDIDSPFLNGFDEDWVNEYREQWLIKQQQPSKSLTDLVSSKITDETRKVEFILYRMQKWDSQRKVRLNLSKKPRMMKELMGTQVQQLVNEIRNLEKNGDKAKDEIKQKCLLFTQKMSKALDKIAEYM